MQSQSKLAVTEKSCSSTTSPLEWKETGQFLINSQGNTSKSISFARSGHLTSQCLVYTVDRGFTTRIPIREQLMKVLMNPPTSGQYTCVSGFTHSYIILPSSNDTISILYCKDGLWFRSLITLKLDEVRQICQFIVLWNSLDLEHVKDGLVLWIQIIMRHLHPDDNNRIYEQIQHKMVLIGQALGITLAYPNENHPLFTEYFAKYTQAGPHQGGIQILKTLMQV